MNMEKADRTIAEFFRTLIAVPVSYVFHLTNSIMISLVILAAVPISIIYAIFPIRFLRRARNDLIDFLINQ